MNHSSRRSPTFLDKQVKLAHKPPNSILVKVNKYRAGENGNECNALEEDTSEHPNKMVKDNQMKCIQGT